jgi:outer membrane lipoprotein SlyB
MKKRLIATFMMIAMLAVMLPFSASTASAQSTRYNGNNRNYNQRVYNQRVYNQRVYKKPSVYSKHRNLINIGIGTGAGAILGALFGGKKGAAVGALVGGGGAAVYSYGIKPKNKIYYHRRY